jgi:hypothetical protein
MVWIDLPAALTRAHASHYHAVGFFREHAGNHRRYRALMPVVLLLLLLLVYCCCCYCCYCCCSLLAARYLLPRSEPAAASGRHPACTARLHVCTSARLHSNLQHT